MPSVQKFRATNAAVPFYKWESKKPVAVYRNGVKYFQKYLYLYAASGLPGGKVYFPYDADLGAALITEIQVIPSTYTAKPFEPVRIASDAMLAALTCSFMNWDSKYQIDALPLNCLVHNAFVNERFWNYFRLNFIPEKSFISTPDGSVIALSSTVVFLFTYKIL